MEEIECTLYYYENSIDMLNNRFQNVEEFETIREAYDRLEELYEDGDVSKECYENAYIIDENDRKYKVIDISEDDD